MVEVVPWSRVLERLSLVAETHPCGFAWNPDSTRTCGDCIWSKLRGPGPKKLRCVGFNHLRVEATWTGCQFWTDTSLDCLTCGACCSAAYDVVEVSSRDPVRRLQPEWIVQREGRFQMRRRSNNTCAALESDLKCTIYSDRPRCCRDFERGGDNCWFARRRLQLM